MGFKAASIFASRDSDGRGTSGFSSMCTICTNSLDLRPRHTNFHYHFFSSNVLSTVCNLTMVSYSKLPHASCQQLAHPWTSNCLLWHADMFYGACVGGTIFFGFYYLYDLANSMIKTNKLPDMEIKKLFKRYVQIVTFIIGESTGCVVSSCILRKLLGRYYYSTIVILPGTISGLSAAILEPPARLFFTSVFANMTLELIIKELQRLRFKLKIIHKLILFILTSGLLSTLLSISNELQLNNHCLWFFKPNFKVTNSETCWHKETCQKYLTQEFLKYSLTGASVTILKELFKNGQNPKIVGKTLFNWRTYKLAALLGTYSLVYQLVRCWLFKKKSVCSRNHHTLAGLIAGFSFLFEPNMTILNSSLITSLQVAVGIAIDKKILPNIPYSVIAFAICNGILFHYGITQPTFCPNFMVFIMSITTHKRTDYISRDVLNYLCS